MESQPQNPECRNHPENFPPCELQSDSATITDACETWINLLHSTELEPYHVKVDKRSRQAMAPTHYLANLFHPVGKKSDPDHINSAQEMLLEWNADSVLELLSFRSDSLPLPKALTHQSVIETRNATNT